jgi:hypothetical protein
MVVGWKHGKVYKKIDEKISSLKRGSFSQKHKKVDLNFILKLLSFQLGLL